MTSSTEIQFAGLETKIDGKLMVIKFNVPKKKNALTPTMYKGLAHFLKVAAQDDNVTMVAFTGNGDFYTSGNDFGALMKGDPDDSSDEDPNTKAIRTVR